MVAVALYNDEPPPKHVKRLVALYLLFGGLHACVITLMLLFSLGPLVTSGGRAWEYELVWETFIASLIELLLLVVLPSVVAHGLWKGRKWAKLALAVAAAVSMLVGLLLAVSFVPELGFWGVTLSGSYLGLSAYSCWYVYRGKLSNNGMQRTRN